MNTPVPTWRELGQRIALLIIVEARAVRRWYRHWRVRRRYRKFDVVRIAAAPFPRWEPGSPIPYEPGQIIFLRNGERPDQFVFRPPNPGSMIPGPRRTASEYKLAKERLAAIHRAAARSNAETDAERAWLAARPGGKR